MYKNKHNGRNNLCGEKIRALRKQQRPALSQRALADLLLQQGIDLDKNAVQRIETGLRFVTDIELKAFAAVFQLSADELLSGNP